MNVRVEIAEGLVIGPDDTLVVRVKDRDFWDEASTDDFQDHLRMVLGDRFLIIVGDVEIAKVEA